MLLSVIRERFAACYFGSTARGGVRVVSATTLGVDSIQRTAVCVLPQMQLFSSSFLLSLLLMRRYDRTAAVVLQLVPGAWRMAHGALLLLLLLRCVHAFSLFLCRTHFPPSTCCACCVCFAPYHIGKSHLRSMYTAAHSCTDGVHDIYSGNIDGGYRLYAGANAVWDGTTCLSRAYLTPPARAYDHSLPGAFS